MVNKNQEPASAKATAGPVRGPASNGAGKEGKLIGKVVHYFDKIAVAVISLDSSLAVGDTIRIAGGENTDFTQTVESMQVEHEEIKKAKKGDEVGLKVEGKVREGYKVYKI